MTTMTLRELAGTELTLAVGIRRLSQFEPNCFVLKPSDVVNKKHPARPHAINVMSGPTAQMGDVAINLDYRPGCAMEIDDGLIGAQPTKGVVFANISSSHRVDDGFLRAWFLSGELERQLQPRHKGSTMTYVKLEDLLNTVIPTPALDMQRSLAGRFADAAAELKIASRYAEQAREMMELESRYLVEKAIEHVFSTGR